MQLNQLLTQACTIEGAAWSSKKRVLEQASELLSSQFDHLDVDAIYNGLLSRERLGSTGLGGGIAIPHCRLQDCDKVTGALIHLKDPVDFDARDNQPVDLIFVLLAPEEAHDSHLQALARVAGLLQDESNLQRLRRAGSAEALYQTALDIAAQTS